MTKHYKSVVKYISNDGRVRFGSLFIVTASFFVSFLKVNSLRIEIALFCLDMRTFI